VRVFYQNVLPILYYCEFVLLVLNDMIFVYGIRTKNISCTIVLRDIKLQVFHDSHNYADIISDFDY